MIGVTAYELPTRAADVPFTVSVIDFPSTFAKLYAFVEFYLFT